MLCAFPTGAKYLRANALSLNGASARSCPLQALPAATRGSRIGGVAEFFPLYTSPYLPCSSLTPPLRQTYTPRAAGLS